MNDFIDIIGFEGYYQMNSIGQFRSVDRWVNSRSNSTSFLKGRDIKTSLDGHGYYKVGLCKNGEIKNIRIHILIGKHFIPNPSNYKLIRHLNDIKTDNRLENLAWGTDQDNANDCVRNGNHRCRRGKDHHWYGRRVTPPNKGLKGIHANNNKTILDLRNGSFYYGTQDAANARNVNANTLRAKLNGFIKNNLDLIYV